MNETIKNAIEESISRDCSPGVYIESAEIYDAMEGVDYDDAVEVEPGVFDVWGTDDDGQSWRLEVRLISKGGREL